jgi:hypothetical protein
MHDVLGARLRHPYHREPTVDYAAGLSDAAHAA